MKKVTTSPSELSTWNDCHRAWYFKYDRKIMPREEKISPPMASGIAVHYVIETLCRDYPMTMPVAADVRVRAEDSLMSTFADHHHRDAQVKKFLPGVLRALGKVPEDIWMSDWIVETDLEGVFANDNIEVTLKGRPDMYRLIEDWGLEIVDLKTTASEPLDNMLWNPQIRWYAAALKQKYPTRQLSYRYVCVPTQGEKPAPQSPPWPFTKRQHDEAVADLLKRAEDYNPDITDARYSRNCAYCDYKAICMGIIGGADPTGIAKELFVARRRRN